LTTQNHFFQKNIYSNKNLWISNNHLFTGELLHEAKINKIFYYCKFVF